MTVGPKNTNYWVMTLQQRYLVAVRNQSFESINATRSRTDKQTNMQTYYKKNVYSIIWQHRSGTINPIFAFISSIIASIALGIVLRHNDGNESPEKQFFIWCSRLLQLDTDLFELVRIFGDDSRIWISVMNDELKRIIEWYWLIQKKTNTRLIRLLRNLAMVW